MVSAIGIRQVFLTSRDALCQFLNATNVHWKIDSVLANLLPLVEVCFEGIWMEASLLFEILTRRLGDIDDIRLFERNS